MKIWSTALGVAALAADPAAAQTSPAEPPQSEQAQPSEGLADIIVTARKRQESAQDIPVTVRAIDAETLDRLAVGNLDQIAEITPGLALNVQGSGVQNVINIRGIESGAIGVGFDQPVSIVVDGVQFSNAEFLRVGQFDLERVEVLKGPQALFFGRNSPAGVISIQTADPTPELFTELRGGYEWGTNRAIAQAVVAGPLSDSLGARLALSFTDSNGWWTNLYPGVAERRAPRYQEVIARGTLVAKPNEDFTARAKFTYHRNRGADFTYQDLVGCRGDIRSYAPFDDCTLNGRGESADPSDWPNFNPSLSPLWAQDPYSRYNTYIGSIDINYAFSEALSLTSVTGYNRLDNQRFDNINTGGAPQSLFLGERQEQDSFSQELRVTGDFDPLRLMVGAYYDDRALKQDSALVLFGTVTPFNIQEIKGRSLSIFGQASLELIKGLELSVGGRYTDENKNFTGRITQGNGFVVDGVPVRAGDPLRVLDPRISEDNFSPEITLGYRPTSDLFLFAAYREAFKSGSFSTSQTASRFLSVRPARTSFLSETVDGFEAGVKSEWLDNRLRINVTAFDFGFKNLQLSAFDPQILSTRVFNAGAARTKGVELETVFAPRGIRGLTLSVNVAYLDAYYERWLSNCNLTQITDTGAAGGCNVNVDGNAATSAGGVLAGTGFEAQDRRGDTLRNAPRWSVQLGGVYTRDVTGDLRLNMNVNAAYTSQTNVDPLGDARGINNDYVIYSAGLGLSATDDAWSIDLIGRNLTDKRIALFAEQAGLSGNRAFNATINPPRQIFLRLTVRPSAWGR